METVGERLRKARKERKLSRAQAGDKLGIAASTVASHENGQTEEPRMSVLRQYAKLYKKRIDWIITAQGSEDATDLIAPLMGYIGAGGDIGPEYEQIPEGGLEDIELLVDVRMDAVAFEVSGISMLPKYESGTLIICSRDGRDPESMLHVDCAVRTTDGRRFLKKIKPGRKRGLYTLVSFNAEDIVDVGLAWVGEILATIPSNRRTATLSPRKRVAAE